MPEGSGRGEEDKHRLIPEQPQEGDFGDEVEDSEPTPEADLSQPKWTGPDAIRSNQKSVEPGQQVEPPVENTGGFAAPEKEKEKLEEGDNLTDAERKVKERFSELARITREQREALERGDIAGYDRLYGEYEKADEEFIKVHAELDLDDKSWFDMTEKFGDDYYTEAEALSKKYQELFPDQSPTENQLVEEAEPESKLSAEEAETMVAEMKRQVAERKQIQKKETKPEKPSAEALTGLKEKFAKKPAQEKPEQIVSDWKKEQQSHPEKGVRDYWVDVRRTEDQGARQAAIANLREHYQNAFAEAKSDRAKSEIERKLATLDFYEKNAALAGRYFDAPKMKSGGETVTVKELRDGKEVTVRYKPTPENWKALSMSAFEQGVAADEMDDKTLAELHEIVETRSYRAYREVQEFAKMGMGEDEMDKKFIKWARKNGRLPRYAAQNVSPRQLDTAREVFWKDIKEQPEKYEHPLKKSFREAASKLLRIEDKLEGKSPEQRDEIFKQYVRENLSSFIAYSVKAKDGEIIQGSRANRDADVGVSLWLLREAGLQNVEKNATAVPQGSAVEGKFALDTSASGLTGMEFIQYKKPDGKEETVLAAFDNHSEHRVYPTSAAKILFEAMQQNGFFDEKRKEYASWDVVARMMIEHTRNDDNAMVPTIDRKDPRALKEAYNASDETFWGLAWALQQDQIYRFFRDRIEGRIPIASYDRTRATRKVTKEEANLDHWYKLYVESINSRFTEAEKDEFRLKHRKGSEGREDWSPIDRAHKNVVKAREFLDRSDEDLQKEGRLFFVQRGAHKERYFVNIVRTDGDFFEPGHKALKAYGYDGYLSIDVRDPANFSFLLNTLQTRVDLSDNKQLKALKKKGGVLVRGAMFLRDRNAEHCDITPKDLVKALGVAESNIPRESDLAKVMREYKGEIKEVDSDKEYREIAESSLREALRSLNPSFDEKEIDSLYKVYASKMIPEMIKNLKTKPE